MQASAYVPSDNFAEYHVRDDVDVMFKVRNNLFSTLHTKMVTRSLFIAYLSILELQQENKLSLNNIKIFNKRHKSLLTLQSLNLFSI